MSASDLSRHCSIRSRAVLPIAARSNHLCRTNNSPEFDRDCNQVVHLIKCPVRVDRLVKTEGTIPSITNSNRVWSVAIEVDGQLPIAVIRHALVRDMEGVALDPRF